MIFLMFRNLFVIPSNVCESSENVERSSEEKEESVLCTDDLRCVETQAKEQSVVSVSGSSFNNNISLIRMLSGSFSSKLSPPCTVAEVVVVLLSAITG